MPDTDHYSALPIPTYAEDPDGPAAFSAFRAAVAPSLVLFATTTSDRDTKYADAPVGTIVSSSTTQNVWKKTASGWITLYTDTGNVLLSSATWGPDCDDAGSYYRIRGDGSCSVYINCTYTGDATGAGNIADIQMVTLPTAARPPVMQFGVGIASSGEQLGTKAYTGGSTRIGAVLAGDGIDSGATITASFYYQVNI